MTDSSVTHTPWSSFDFPINNIRFVGFLGSQSVIMTDKHTITRSIAETPPIRVYTTVCNKSDVIKQSFSQSDGGVIVYYNSERCEFEIDSKSSFTKQPLSSFVHPSDLTLVKELLGLSSCHNLIFDGIRIFHGGYIWSFDPAGMWLRMSIGTPVCPFTNKCIMRCHSMSHAYYNPDLRMINYTSHFDRQPDYRPLTIPINFHLIDFGFAGARLIWFVVVNIATDIAYCGWSRTHHSPYRWYSIGKLEIGNDGDAFTIAVNEEYCVCASLSGGITTIPLLATDIVEAPFR